MKSMLQHLIEQPIFQYFSLVDDAGVVIQNHEFTVTKATLPAKGDKVRYIPQGGANDKPIVGEVIETLWDYTQAPEGIEHERFVRCAWIKLRKISG